MWITQSYNAICGEIVLLNARVQDTEQKRSGYYVEFYLCYSDQY